MGYIWSFVSICMSERLFFYVKNVDETKEVSMKYDFEAFFKAKWILEFF